MQEVIAPGFGKFGKYVLHERVGAGGMAEVWVATLPGAEGIDKRCVLKRILPRHAGDPTFVKMFLEEARISISLQHGNIVPVFDFGEAEGTYYLAMECVHGVDLRAVVRQIRDSASSFPVELSAHVVLEVCRGLAYAHTKVGADGRLLGLIHRDVSPSNVLISFEGDVKLTDFGIAKVRGSSVQTEASELKGKISYMSPEQARGEPIDARTDLWAAGVVLYELLTSRRPYEADDLLVVLEKVRMGAPIAPPRSLRPEIPEQLDRIARLALSPDPSARHRDARSMQVALSRFLATRAPVTAADLRAFLRRLFPSESERFNPALSVERRAIEPLEGPPVESRPPGIRTVVVGTSSPAVETAVTEVLHPKPGTAPTAAGPAVEEPALIDERSYQHETVSTAPSISWETLDVGEPLARTTLHRRSTESPRRPRWLVGGLVVAAGGMAGAALAMMLAGREPAQPSRTTPSVPASIGRSLASPPPSRAPAPMAQPPGAAAAAPESAPAAPPIPAAAPRLPAAPPEPEEGARPRARAAGTPRPGTLVVTSLPWAEVFIDGRRRAESTPATLPLSPGPHSVRLVNPETGGQDVRQVEIRAGETTRMSGHPR